MNTSIADAGKPEEKQTPSSGSLHWTEPIVLEQDGPSIDALLHVPSNTHVFSAQRDVLQMAPGDNPDLELFADRQVSQATTALARSPNNPHLTNNLAAAYLLARRPSDALNLLLHLEYASAPISLRLTMARAFAQSGDYEQAIRIYRDVASAEPRNVDALLELAGALVNQGDLETSRHVYEQALIADPVNAWAANNLGILKAASRDLNGAVRTFRTAVRSHERFAVAYNNLGLCFSQRSEFAKAIQYFKIAVRLIPTYKGAYFNLAHALINSARFAEAEQILRAARTHFPDDAQLNDLLGDVWIRTSEWNRAVIVYRESIARFGVSYVRLNNVGVALARLDRPNDAEEVWRGALESNNAEHHAYFNLIWLLIRARRYTEADTIARRALGYIALDSEGFSDVLAAYATLLFQTQRADLAESLLTENIKHGSATVRIYTALEALHGEYGNDYAAAVNVVRQALEAFPGRWRLQNNLAYDLIMTGELDEAEQILAGSAKHVGVDPFFTATKGLYYLRRGDTVKATALYEQAAQLSHLPVRRRIRQKFALELGRYYLVRDDRVRARRHLKRAIELKTDGNFLRQARSLIDELNSREALER